MQRCVPHAEMRAHMMLAASNLRLHKIASNRPAILEAFPLEDRAMDIKDLNPLTNDLPPQRRLGVSWNIARRNIANIATRQAAPQRPHQESRGLELTPPRKQGS